MIEIHKNLRHRDVKGKKIRESDVIVGLYIYLFLLILVPIYSFFTVDWETIKVLLCIYLPFILFFASIILLTHLFNKVVCVLTEDKLYFFNQSATIINRSTGKIKEYVCDGSVDYADIKQTEFIPAVKRGIIKRREIIAKHVIIKGTDFKIEIINAGKGLIKNIQKFSSNSSESPPLPDFDHLKHERNGIWDEIWEAFDVSRGEGIFDKDTKIEFFNNDEADNAIGIGVISNGVEITFHIDEDGLFMLENTGKRDVSVPMSGIPSIEYLYSQMRGFLYK